MVVIAVFAWMRAVVVIDGHIRVSSGESERNTWDGDGRRLSRRVIRS